MKTASSQVFPVRMAEKRHETRKVSTVSRMMNARQPEGARGPEPFPAAFAVVVENQRGEQERDDGQSGIKMLKQVVRHGG